ncbi:hypothetical protein QUF74_05225 [Candidatus Halobeggiatoa sp. HSG11]|nr:hypothetical protein [Candidatus Halobeggiatoa sp. HSG11]
MPTINFLISDNIFPLAQLPKYNGTSQSIKIDDFIKYYKNTRSNIKIKNDQITAILAVTCAKIFEIELSIILPTTEDATNWNKIEINYESPKPLTATDKKLKKLLDAADKLGFYHSKPLNTLSNVQFCPEPDNQTQGEHGFTANQLSDATAKISISGGTNADSAFYACLITRINGSSIAEHLVNDRDDSQQIQQFFQQVISKPTFKQLQDKLTQAFGKTASCVESLHVMDKQILLPVFDGENDYIAITPIINPVVFAASAKEWFYVKNQSNQFKNISLGGSNPSNAGTATGEVAGQNSRFQMKFPKQSKKQARRYLFMLNKTGRFLWYKDTQDDVEKQLAGYENSKLPNKTRERHLEIAVDMAINSMMQQVHSIQQHYENADESDKKQLIAETKLIYQAVLFNNIKLDKDEKYAPFYEALKSSFKKLPKFGEKIHDKIVDEIWLQFEQKITLGGGF